MFKYCIQGQKFKMKNEGQICDKRSKLNTWSKNLGQT